MMGKTHRAIGYTTTLVLIVYTDIGVIPSLIGFIGCTAPDIDIKLKIRHRGITHWVLTSIVLYYLFSIFNKNIAYAFWINYILHLLADSLTVEGCPLFAPFYNPDDRGNNKLYKKVVKAYNKFMSNMKDIFEEVSENEDY